MSEYLNELLVKEVEKGNLKNVKRLHKEGANLFALYSGDATLLHIASYHDHVDIVDYLIKNGLDVNAKDKLDNTPLHIAAEQNSGKTAKKLIDNGADIYAVRRGFTIYNYHPLHTAVFQRSFQVVEEICNKDKNIVNVLDDFFNNPFHICATTYSKFSKQYKKMLDTLYNCGANVNGKNIAGDVPLHIAAEHENIEIADFLLKKGCNINEKNNYGDTPLHRAAWSCEPEMVRFLLENKADPNIENKEGMKAYNMSSSRKVKREFDEFEYRNSKNDSKIEGK